ncbi:MAG: 50S ribosomal protein L19 [Chitinophagaceae bacterium]|nr:50S ribosomal protein L19 [Chitinophagaceae bacterium]
MNAVSFVHDQLDTKGKAKLPNFKAGDNVTVNYKIVEGTKERIQSFKGDVIKRQGTGATASFTVRKMSDGVGVERLFPVFSPNIESVILHKVGNVNRAKLYYLRDRSGKSARISEKEGQSLKNKRLYKYIIQAGSKKFCPFLHFCKNGIIIVLSSQILNPSKSLYPCFYSLLKIKP